MPCGSKRRRVAETVLAGVESLMSIIAPPPESEGTASAGRQSSLGPCESISSDASPPPCHSTCEVTATAYGTQPIYPSRTNMAHDAVQAEKAADDGSCLFDVMPGGACLGAEVMEQLRRGDEAVAEECLFLARAYARRVCVLTLGAVVGCMQRHGWRQSMAAMQHAALQEAFLQCLCDRDIFAGEPDLQRQVLSFVALLFSEAHHEALLRVYVVRFLVDALGAAHAVHPGAPLRSPRTPLARITATHWSLQRPSKRTRCDTAPAITMHNEVARRTAGVEAQLSAMGCAVQLTRSRARVALDMLVQLLLARNQYSESTAGMPNVALLFVRLGGLATLLAHAYVAAGERRAVLTLLELLTASAALAEEEEALRAIARWLLLRSLANGGSSSRGDAVSAAQKDVKIEEEGEDGNEETQGCVAVLRALTNVTNLCPGALHRDDVAVRGCEVEQLGHCLRAMLHRAWSCEDAELVTYVLCSAVNIVKWEVKERLDRFATAFVSAGEGDAEVTGGATLYDTLAERMLAAHAKDETDRLVLSGYYALLLAVLSLVTTRQQSLRIPVITAIAKASHDSDIGKQVAHQPMKIVVAIVQEFLLFQSQAGTLTRQHVVETQAIVAEVVAANKISVSDE